MIIFPFSFGATHSFFIANVNVIVENTSRANCVTYDIGLLPSSFPYKVFRPSTLNFQKYLERLRNVGVPHGYTEALERLAKMMNSELKGLDSGPGAQVH